MAQTNTPGASNKRPLILGGILAVLVLVLVGELMMKNGKREEAKETPTPAPTPSAATPSTPAATAASYKDGTYSADGSYQSPEGNDSIGVQLTLANGVITDVVVTPKSTETSGRWQARFAKGVSAVVVGKKIDDVKLDNVAGSSLTPIGFNAAVEAIKAKAKI